MNSFIKGWERVLLLIIPYFVIVGIFQFIGLIIARVDYQTLHFSRTTEQQLILSVFNLIGTLFLLWLFMRFVDREKFVTLGLKIKNRLKEINIGLVLGFLIMGVSLLILFNINQIEFQEVIFNFKELILSVFVFAIVSVVEEVLFRGYILRNLMLSFNKYLALIISSLLFAFAHTTNPNMDWFPFFNLFLAGILLGVSYIYTKNLWFPIALHYSWNFFQTLFGFNVSGQDFYSLIEIQISNNNLLNGGDFGFEGSVFSIIAQVLSIGIILVYYERIKPKKLNIFRSFKT